MNFPSAAPRVSGRSSVAAKSHPSIRAPNAEKWSKLRRLPRERRLLPRAAAIALAFSGACALGPEPRSLYPAQQEWGAKGGGRVPIVTELLVFTALVCWPLSPAMMAVLWGTAIALARWGRLPDPIAGAV